MWKIWSEIGSGFGEQGGTPPLRISRSTLPPGPEKKVNVLTSVANFMTRTRSSFSGKSNCYTKLIKGVFIIYLEGGL